jgi:hypothetical protein
VMYRNPAQVQHMICILFDGIHTILALYGVNCLLQLL